MQIDDYLRAGVAQLVEHYRLIYGEDDDQNVDHFKMTVDPKERLRKKFDGMIRPNRIAEALAIIPNDRIVELLLVENYQKQLNSNLLKQFEFEDHIENGKSQANRASDLPVSMISAVDPMDRVFGVRTYLKEEAYEPGKSKFFTPAILKKYQFYNKVKA